MCGIAVVNGNLNKSNKIIYEMIDKIKHRGPDEKGFLKIFPNTLLGHTRLSIIDIKSGKQPITNEKGNLAIVFNGEIYNFKELRRNLVNKHKFKTQSDTEVILHLYEEYGEECFSLLEGMFAIVIAGPKGLIIARDPLGIKPLYYGTKNKNFYVASELKQFPLPMDTIYSLPAGSYMVNSKIKKFVSPLDSSEQIYDLDIKEIKKHLKILIEEAVEKRLVADVPVGVFLSGGFDSSLVASIMKKYRKKIHSFTAGMENAPDILRAKEMANYLKTDHHQLVYTKKDMEKALEKVIYHLESFDAPIVRSSIPMYFISKVASQYVKVVLSGEGADELFAGYSYLENLKGVKLRKELNKAIKALEKTNLQRADRIGMAFALEVRVPFLDYRLLKFSLRIPYKFLEFGNGKMEKHLLRETFKNHLPEKILKRKKMKFSIGAGSFSQFFDFCSNKIKDTEFIRNRHLEDGFVLRSKEEYFYYKIFKEIYNNKIPLKIIGRTVDKSAGTEREKIG